MLHGEKDRMIRLDVLEHYLDVYGINADLHTIPGLDHTFNKRKWEEEVLDYTVGFLEGELLGGNIKKEAQGYSCQSAMITNLRRMNRILPYIVQ